MSQLAWEPLDFILVLGVAPEVSEWDESHTYVVSQPPLRLEIILNQCTGDVQLDLHVSSFQSAVARYRIKKCPGVRRVEDKRGQFMEFAAAGTFAGRYDGYSVIPYGVRVSVAPHVCVEPFAYPI